MQTNYDALVQDLEAWFLHQREHDELMRLMREKAEFQDQELGYLRRLVMATPLPAMAHEPASKIRVPEPSSYGGSRDAKDLENFLWDMDSYFKAARVADHDQVDMAAMFLNVDTKLWWCTRMAEDLVVGWPRIATWANLKKELREQFLPCNTSWVAREATKKLRQTDSTRDYVREFSSLLLDVSNMSEEDKLFNFLSRLQLWAQAELRR